MFMNVCIFLMKSSLESTLVAVFISIDKQMGNLLL